MTAARHDPSPKTGSIKRTDVCKTCGATTVQMRHGYTIDGKLWKGHVCVCKGWHCQSCQAVTEKKRACCR